MTAKLKRLRPGQLDCLVLDYMKAHRKEGPLTATTIAKGLGGRSAGAAVSALLAAVEEGEYSWAFCRDFRAIAQGNRMAHPTQAQL